MSNSNAILVGDAIVAELNAQQVSWARQFQARRGWLPVYELKDLQDLTVTVVVPDRDGERLSRAQVRYTYTVFINVQQKVNAKSLTDMDALVNLVDRDMTTWFQDWHYLAGLDLTRPRSQQWSINDAKLDGNLIYDHVRLYDEGVFDSTLVLTVKGNQP